MTLTRDDWLSGLLGKPAYHVGGVPADCCREEIPGGRAFVGAKVAVEDVAGLLHLQQLGFRVIDLNIQLQRPAGPFAPAGPGVRFAVPSDEAGVRDVAYQSFVHNRFHRDPQVSQDTASRIKAEWAGNFFAGKRGDWMVVAESGGQVAGFLQLLNRKGAVVIDLVAVARAHEGRGLARSMIFYASQNCAAVPPAMQVGTQIANIRSLGLYTRLGFQVASAASILHLHCGEEPS